MKHGTQGALIDALIVDNRKLEFERYRLLCKSNRLSEMLEPSPSIHETHEAALRELHTGYLCGNWSRTAVTPDHEGRSLEVWHNYETQADCLVMWWYNRNTFQVFDLLERFRDGTNVKFCPEEFNEQFNDCTMTDEEEKALVARLERDRNSPNI